MFAKASYGELKEGRFELEVLRERHLVQFQTRKKTTKAEGWAESVKLLTYPELSEVSGSQPLPKPDRQSSSVQLSGSGEC